MQHSGQGPLSTNSQTYSEIQKEIEERDRAIRNRFTTSTPDRLPPGAVPHNPQNVWNEVDREPDPPLPADDAE